MKLAGKKIDGPRPQTIVFPRGDDEIIITAQPVLDFEPFDQISPRPTPPEIMRQGGQRSKDVEDPDFIKQLEEWGQCRFAWMVIKSLEATEGLEWDTVDVSNPETYGNVIKEINDTFSPVEGKKLIELIHTVCGLNEEIIDEATKRFLAGPEVVSNV